MRACCTHKLHCCFFPLFDVQEVDRDPNAMQKYLADDRFQLALQVR